MKNFKRSIAAAAVISALSVSAQVVAADEEAEKQVEKQVEKITVTGSRIRRIDLEPTQPVTSIDGSYIDDRGLTNAMDALLALPGVSAGATPIIADNEAAASQGVGQNTISLYGLGSQRTLTLINGGRMVSSNSPIGGSSAPGSQVDVNNIPVSLIDRVEVVKVGGAPVYGADAVSGVVNYILKKDYEGAEVSYDYTDLDGFGTETSFKVLLGGNFDSDKGNIVLALEHNKTENIGAKDVPYLSNDYSSFTPVGDDALADPATGEVPGGQVRLYPNPRASILSNWGLITPGGTAATNIGLGLWGDGNFWHFDPAGTGNLAEYDGGTPVNSQVWASGGDGLNLAEGNTAQEGYERYNLTAIANYELTDDINLNVTAFANSSDAANQGYQASLYNSGIWNGTDAGSLRFNTSHPFLSDQARTFIEGELGAGSDFYMHKAWLDLGQREIINESHVRSIRATLEGEFELAEQFFDWEVSYQKGESSVFSQDEGVSSARLWAAMDVGVNPDTGAIDCKYNYEDGYGEGYRAEGFGLKGDNIILGDVGKCVAINPFVPVTEEGRDYVTYNTMGKTSLEQEIFNAYISGEVVELPAGIMQMALGYEKRSEFASYAPDGTGVLTGFADSSTSGRYTTDDIFAEFYIPLVSEDMDIPLVHSLSSEMSYRQLDNSNAGSDSVFAVGINYRPFEDVIIRANTAETARAPAVTELFSPVLRISAFATDPCQDTNLEKGPNPSVRQANCASEGIPTDFKSDAAVASREGLSGGNDSLKNEKATSTNIGIVYSPSFVEGLTLSVDWVEISIEDAILSFTLTDIMEACYDGEDYPNIFCTYFTRDANNQLPARDAFTSGYVNAALREFESVEYQVNYTQDVADLPLVGSIFPTNAGEFSVNFKAYNLKKNATSNTGFDFTDNTGQYNNPEWRSQLVLTHRLDNLTTFFNMSYHGEGKRNVESTDLYNYLDENGNPYDTVDSYALYNVGASYNLTEQVTLRASIDNVTDWNASPVEVSLARFAWGRTVNLGITAKF